MRKRQKGRQQYSVLTINGRIVLRRLRWHCPQESSDAPTDRLLDAAEATFSRGIHELACRINQGSTSFAQTAENLWHAARLKVSDETLRQLVERDGEEAAKKLRRAELAPGWTAEDCRVESGATRVYQGCDGVKVPLVTEAEKQKRRTKVRQKRRLCGKKRRSLPRLKPGADQSYKEFRVATFYSETMERRFVQATSGDCEATGRMMQRMAVQIDLANADEKIANIDGAPWIRNQIELHGVVDAIGLDFYHLRDNAQKARRSVFGEESPEGKQWLDDLMHTFRHEGFDAAWDRQVAWRSSLTGSQRTAADRLMQYEAERRPMIQYPEFRRRGWQIGSGPTEAECKTTTHRLKGRGRRWTPENAEAMMALACLHDSRLWDDYWQTPDPAMN
jgi:hypothetical protein